VPIIWGKDVSPMDRETHISFVLALLLLSTVLGASILPVQPACFTGDSIVLSVPSIDD
jgi:hypothetical protein